MNALHERFRPGSFADVVGQDRALRQIQAVLSRGWGGRAWWVTGASGVGKTTLARLIAAVGADELNVHELDAGALTPAALRDVEEGMQYRGFGAKGGKAYIVNEAHGLRKDTIRLLLVLLERLPAHVCVIFTTTKAGQESLFENDATGDASPLLSRCTEIVLDNGPETIAAMALRAKVIAQSEGIDGLPDSVYRDAAGKCRGNMRQLFGQRRRLHRGVRHRGHCRERLHSLVAPGVRRLRTRRVRAAWRDRRRCQRPVAGGDRGVGRNAPLVGASQRMALPDEADTDWSIGRCAGHPVEEYVALELVS